MARFKIGKGPEISRRTASGLGLFLRNGEKGNPLDYRTPFWDKAPRAEIVDRWAKVLEASSSLLPDRLSQVEEAQRTKVGPLSPSRPLAERMHQITGYWTAAREVIPHNDTLVAASIHAANELVNKPPNLIPSGLKIAASNLPSNTNSGWPSFTRKSIARNGDLEAALDGSWRELLYAILGRRGQSGGPDRDDIKDRTVFICPQSVAIIENSYFVQALSYLRNSSNHFSAWGTPDDVDRAVAKLFASQNGVPVLASDFSSYDQTCGRAISIGGVTTVKRLYQERFSDELDELHDVMLTIPLIITEKLVITGDHGKASGMVFTNLDGTVDHLTFAHYASMRMGVTLNPLSQFQGDDGLLGFDRSVEPDELFKAYEELGFENNADKQFVGERDTVYLQRYYTDANGYKGIYPTMRALNSLLGQERFHDEEVWGPDLVTLRAIMILENVKNHPLFSQFVRFVASGDKYRLGAEWPGGIDGLLFSKSSNVIQRAKSLAGFVPSYNQERRLGSLRSFETYKLIKEGV